MKLTLWESKLEQLKEIATKGKYAECYRLEDPECNCPLSIFDNTEYTCKQIANLFLSILKATIGVSNNGVI